MTIDTAKVQGRRSLHFEKLQDLRDDLEVLANSPEVKTLGNWNFAQILKHLAVTTRYAYDGAPDFKLPWYFKLMAPLMKKKFIYKPMKPGFILPQHMKRDLEPIPEVPLEDAFEEFQQVLDAFQSTREFQKHAMFGTLTGDEWEQFILRHCEMHLSFAIPT